MKRTINKALLATLIFICSFTTIFAEVNMSSYGLDVKTAFKQGKIGERYVPVSSYTSHYGTTEAYYINGERNEIYTPKSSTYTSGGNTEEVYGYSAVYRIDNTSNKNYIVTLKAQWKGTYSSYSKMTDTWNDKTTVSKNTKLQDSSYTTTILLDKNSSFKEQFIVGETNPSDYKITVEEIYEVSESDYSGIKKALTLGSSTVITNLNINSELALLKKYLNDNRFEYFENVLVNNLDNLVNNYQAKYSTANKTKATVSVSFNKNGFDQDFEIPVKVTIKVPQPMEVRLKGAFVDTWIMVDKEITKTYDVVDIPMAKITASVVDVKDLKILEEQSYLKTYNDKGIEDYLNKYPNGKYSKEWDDFYYSKAKTLSGMVDYLKKYSNGKYVNKVKKEYDEMLENLSNNPPKNFVTVRGGIFTMGDTHSVALDSYYMSKYEVTQKEYEELMGYNPSYMYFRGDNNPVDSVTWYHAVRYANKLSEKEGLKPYYNISDNNVTIAGGNGYRLPTEAEWEYAARGGNQSKGYKYAGSNNVDEVAEYKGNNDKTTKPVGGKKANELGIYDMSGNVEEWCWDWYGDYSYSAQTNPTGPSSGDSRVRRGGRWFDSASNIIVTNRYSYAPSIYYSNLGFRLVRSF